jgi:hypothetical protein
MKNLTEKQELIIADITNEFIKINEEKKNRPKGGLFDIDGLLGQREADIEERFQIERNNKFYDEILQTKIQEDMDVLNIDLKQMKLIATRPKNWSSWVRGFQIDTIENFERGYFGLSDDTISLKYRLIGSRKNFVSGISSIEEYKNQHNIESCNRFFSNLQQFAKEGNVIGSIKRLINNANL